MSSHFATLAGAIAHCLPEPEPPRTSVLSARLTALIEEHCDLDGAIAALLLSGNRDDLLISRLKKRKLQIKDEIALATPAL